MVKSNTKKNIERTCFHCGNKINMQTGICVNCGKNNFNTRSYNRGIKSYKKSRTLIIFLIFILFIQVIGLEVLFYNPKLLGIKDSTMDHIKGVILGEKSASKEVDNQIENMASEPTTSVIESIDTQDQDAYRIIHYSGTKVYDILIPTREYNIDLDGDGAKEKIVFDIYGTDEYTQDTMELSDTAYEYLENKDFDDIYSDWQKFFENTPRDLFYTNNIVLSELNNGEIISIDGEQYESYMILSDIDSADCYLDVILPGFIDASAPGSHILRYRNGEFINLGWVNGFPDSYMTVDGSGIVTVIEYYEAHSDDPPQQIKYRVVENKLVEIDRKLYIEQNPNDSNMDKLVGVYSGTEISKIGTKNTLHISIYKKSDLIANNDVLQMYEDMAMEYYHETGYGDKTTVDEIVTKIQSVSSDYICIYDNSTKNPVIMDVIYNEQEDSFSMFGDVYISDESIFPYSIEDVSLENNTIDSYVYVYGGNGILSDEYDYEFIVTK